MSRSSCIIVDDEPLCRAHLRQLIESGHELDVVGEADSVQTAVQAIESLKPEIVFLDIQLRLDDGFSVLDCLHTQPIVIFVTAYDEYAVRAFDVNAVDYLIKPVTSIRLQKALKRACNSRNAQNATPPENLQQKDVALMPLGGFGFFSSLRDILVVEASNHHSRVTFDSGRTCLIRRSMREWAKLLPSSMFHPLDRSFLINVERIQAVDCSSRGGTVILGSRRLALTIGRAAASRLRAILPAQPAANG
ncbi:MAG: LytR/AlgR family response regulator transcription factor [Planctomycetota bacterium]